MKLEFVEKLNRVAKKIQFKGKKYSPEILVVVGVIGTVTSTVLACKATTKLNAITEDGKDKIEKIHDAMEHPETLPQEYTEQDGKKDLAIVYTQTSLAIVKNYAPAVILGSLSLCALVGSNRILKKRNAALAAAYATVDAAFKKYRGNVIEKFGTEVDNEMRYSIKAIEVEDENGKKKTVKTAEIDSVNDWAKFFDEASPYWEKDPEYNLWFLNAQQAIANDKLKIQGYMFLNDIYEQLGIDKTRAGQVIGWIYDKDHPVGDNFIDFGIYDGSADKKRAFVNGYEKSILLEFNCDGNIYELMK